jgi:pimeloyl-ACP methyl ester carboxylesterase
VSIPPSQISPHSGRRVDLPGRYGPIAALYARTAITGHPSPTALLVPGYTGSKEDFAPLLDPIADAGLDAIAIDMPGQYESGGPDDEDAYLPAALGMVIAELVGKLAAEGNPVVLLGHSYGGLVARGAVLAGAPVVGLTLMGSGPAELPDGNWRTVLDFGRRTMREQGHAAAFELWQQFDSHDRGWGDLSPAVIDLLKQRFLRSNPASLLGMAAGLFSEPDNVSLLARELSVRDIRCLVVCGEDDVAWSVPSQRDMADRLEADFAVVPNARHSPCIEAPEAVVDILLATWRSWLSP